MTGRSSSPCHATVTVASSRKSLPRAGLDPSFDDLIISFYTRGRSVRKTQRHLQELYYIAVSPEVISLVTDAVGQRDPRLAKLAA
jgi:hypothetical protein